MRKSFKTGIVAAFAALALSVFGFAGVALAANGSAIDKVIDNGITAVNSALSKGGNYAKLSARSGDTITCTITDGGVNIAHVQDDIISTLVSQVAAQKSNVKEIKAATGIFGTPSGKTTLQVNGATVTTADVTQFAKACVGDSSVGKNFEIAKLDKHGFSVQVVGMTSDYNGTYTMNFVLEEAAPVEPAGSEDITEEIMKPEVTTSINDKINAKNQGLAEVKVPVESPDGRILTWEVEVKSEGATAQKLSDNVVSNILVAAKNARAASAKSLDSETLKEITDLSKATDNDIAKFSKECLDAAIAKKASLQAAGDFNGVRCNIRIAGKNGAEKDFTDYVIEFKDVSSTKTVYRFRDPRSGEHIYTTDINEYNTQTMNNYEAEGARWIVKGTAGAGDQQVVRLRNLADNTHVYVIKGSNEYNKCINGRTHVEESAGGWVNSGTTTVNRLWDCTTSAEHEATNQHLLTTDRNEINVLTGAPYSWLLESATTFQVQGMANGAR